LEDINRGYVKFMGLGEETTAELSCKACLAQEEAFCLRPKNSEGEAMEEARS
jgi:hypothetical protein